MPKIGRARWAPVAAAFAVVIASAQPANAATKPTYVAIVVSSHVTTCVRWHAGITGDEVLNAVVDVRYRQPDGIIVQVDGEPSPARADTDHYWSYWHSSGGGWTYSTVGASGYSPRAGSVEGWRFVEGATRTPPAQNPAGLYAATCGSKDPNPATGSSTHRYTPRPTVTPSSGVGSRTSTISNGQPQGRTSRNERGSSTADVSPRMRTVSPAATASRASQSGRAARSGSTALSGSGHTMPDPPNSTVSRVPIDSGISPVADTPRKSDGSALSAIVALVLVAALGGAASWVAHRRRRFGG